MVVWVGIAVAAVGLFATGALTVAMQGRAINHRAASAQLQKLIGARNLDRAMKLCGAAPGTYMAAVAAAIRAGGRAQTRDPVVLGPTVQTAFDEVAGPRGVAWRRIMAGGIACSVAGVAGGALAVATGGMGRHGPGVWAVGLALVSMFLGFGFAQRFGQFGVAVADARHHLLPGIVQAFAEGATIHVEGHAGA